MQRHTRSGNSTRGLPVNKGEAMRAFSAFWLLAGLVLAGLMCMSPPAWAQEQDDEQGADIVLSDLLDAPVMEEEEPPLENPPEPALRPVHGFLRGVGAFFYHVGKSLAEGNEKFPGLGTVEVFRGIRHGAVELTESTYRGMMHSEPIPYRELGEANEVINGDPFLRHAADTITPGAIVSIAGADAEAAVTTALGVKVGQKVTDKRVFEKRTLDDLEVAESQYEKNREKYIGERANINKNTKGTGNLLKLARR